MSIFSCSWYQGLPAVLYCGTPWTYLLLFLNGVRHTHTKQQQQKNNNNNNNKKAVMHLCTGQFRFGIINFDIGK